MTTCGKRTRAHQGMWAVLCLLLCIPAHGQRHPLQCELSFEQDTVLAGEPVILKYRFTNIGKATVVPDLIRPEREWIRVRGIDSEGISARSVPDNRVPPSGYYYGLRSIDEIAPEASYQSKCVLTQWVNFTHPGDYRVKIHVELPYERYSRAPGNRADGPAFTGDFDLPLKVKPGTIRGIDRIAQEWLKQVESRSHPTNIIAIRALFSMPEGKVLPHWQKMVAHLDMYDCSEIQDQLERLGTPTAKALLEIVTPYRNRVIRKGMPPPSDGE